MDISEFRENLRSEVNNLLDHSNKMWFEILKLIITLSSSCLLITLALVDKLFPNIKTPDDISTYLIISWTSFFLTVVLAIISKLDDLIFFGNVGREKCTQLKKLDRAITEGESPEILIPEKDYVSNSIYWGVAAINTFFIGVITLCLAMLEKIVPSEGLDFIFWAIVVVLVLLNIYIC